MTETSGNGRIGRRGRAAFGCLGGGLAAGLPGVRRVVELAPDMADLPEWLGAVAAAGGWDLLVALAVLAGGLISLGRGVVDLVRWARRRRAAGVGPQSAAPLRGMLAVHRAAGGRRGYGWNGTRAVQAVHSLGRSCRVRRVERR